MDSCPPLDWWKHVFVNPNISQNEFQLDFKDSMSCKLPSGIPLISKTRCVQIHLCYDDPHSVPYEDDVRTNPTNPTKFHLIVYNVKDSTYHIETIHTKTMTESRMVFSQTMPVWILQHIRTHLPWYDAKALPYALFLDGGPTCPNLYFVHHVDRIIKSTSNRIDIVISSIPKKILIEKLQQHLPSPIKFEGILEKNTSIRHISRTYVDAVDTCELPRQVDVDSFFTMIECVPLYHIQRIYEQGIVKHIRELECEWDEEDDKHSLMGSSVSEADAEAEEGSETCYESFGEMLAGWIGILSNRNGTCYYRYMLWINNVLRKEYATLFPFGKYKGTALCDLPQTYIRWLLENDIVKSDAMYKRVFDVQRMQDEHLYRIFLHSTNLRDYHSFSKIFFRYFDRRNPTMMRTMVPSICERPWVSLIRECTSDSTTSCSCNTFVSNRYSHRCCLMDSGFSTMDPIVGKGASRAYHTECLWKSYHYLDRQYKYNYDNGTLHCPNGAFQRFQELT